MDADARRDLLHTVDEHHAVVVYGPNEVADVLDVEDLAHALMSHMAAGRERHLAVLQI